MKHLRLWLVAFCGWLFALYNIERFHEPINLASFIYAFAALVSLPILFFPVLHRMPCWKLLIALTPIVLFIKIQLGYPIAGTHLPITVTELAAIGVTVFLAQRIGRCLEEFQQAVADATTNFFAEGVIPFEQGQADMYREVRRARRHHRPLSMLTISATDETLQATLDRLISEVQEMTVHRWGVARIARLLSGLLKECDVITFRDDRFVALLPETTREDAMEIRQRLQRTARSEHGLELNVGLSCFPDEEVTFVKLLEAAQDLAAGPTTADGDEARDPLVTCGQVVPTHYVRGPHARPSTNAPLRKAK